MRVAAVSDTILVVPEYAGASGVLNSGAVQGDYPKVGMQSEQLGYVKRTGKVECQTCKNRTYVDQSTDAGVSFKAPGHISPEASAAVVASHEGEHVALAKAEGAKPGNKLISASVRLHTSICPECGRAYVSGGTTITQISYCDPNQKRGGVNSIDDDLKGAVVDKYV